MRTARIFPADASSVPAAREFVLEYLPVRDPMLRDQVALMVSELVTNAIVYGSTDFEVAVAVAGEELRIEVADGGAQRPAMRPMPKPTEAHGRGLRIVKELSDRWGVDTAAERPGKRVWFEVALPVNGSPV